MTTQFPQPKYAQPKPHSSHPTSIQSNQAQQAKQFAQPNQPSQANPRSGLIPADGVAMKAMSDD